MFRATTDYLDKFTDAGTSYIHFREGSIVPTCTRVSYNNDKPWFTGKLRQLRLEREAAFRSGDRDGYKEAKYRFSGEVRNAKTERLQQQFSTNNSATLWKGLRQLTNYKPIAPHAADDLRLANSLSDCYCRFDGPSASPETSPDTSTHSIPSIPL